ncbi:MAG TPA: DMT family transporter [Ktedonobacterales bacterium]|nr:DMT family transporter [Ktedonobacterales bacterium]
MKLRDFGVLLALAALWGGSFLFIRVASPALGPVTLAAARVSLAGVALLIFAAARRQGIQARKRWLRFIILGAFNAALPYALIAYAELRLSAGLGAILNATTPLFTAVVAAIWLKDALTPLKVVGLLMGVAGVTALVGWSALPVDAATLLAVGASLAGAFCYAIGSVYARRALAGAAPLASATGQQLGAAVVLLPFAIPIVATHPQSVHLAPVAVGATLALALACTSVAYLLYFHLITHVGPTATVSVTLLVPIFGLLWSAIFLHESAPLGSFVGLAIILASVLLIVGVRLPKRARRAKATQDTHQATQVGAEAAVESVSLVD